MKIKLITQLKHIIKESAIMATRASLQTVSRHIMPYKIVEKRDHVIVENSTLVRACVIGIPKDSKGLGYPEHMNPFIMSELLAIESKHFRLQISYGLNHVDNFKAMSMFDEADYHIRLEKDSYIDHKHQDTTKQPPHVLNLEEDNIKRNIEALYSNDETLFRTSLIILIKSETEAGLRSAESQIKATFKGSRIYPEFPDAKHLPTIFHSMMRPLIWKRTECLLFSYHAAIMLPIISPGNRLQSEGVLFGETAEINPRAVQINMEALSNQSMCIIGSSGTGKTYYLMLYLMRSLVMEKKRVIHITPKADEGTSHIHVVNYFNGCLIELGRDKNKNINPFEIFAVNVTLQNAETLFYTHVDILKNFFLALILSETANRDNMISYLEKTIHETYYKNGIKLNDPSTWKNWPFLTDIYQIWEAEKDENSTAEALYNKAGSIMTSWKYLSAPSNIDLTNDFIVFDTSGMRSGIDKLQEAYNILITAMMSMRFSGNRNKKTIISVDEGRVFLQDPKIASFLMRLLMEGRSAGIGLVIAVQQPSDLIKANVADEMKTNINVNVVLGGMTSLNVDIVTKYFSLDSSARNALLTLGQGSGLVMVGNQIIPTVFKSTPLEHAIIKGGEVSEVINTKTQAFNSVLSFISESIEQISNQQNICFDDWLNCDPELLRQKGFSSQKGVDCMTGKNMRVWLKEVPGNMSDDHFCTICRLAGELIKAGHKVDINHYETVDIVVNDTIALEYERPKSHTIEELCKKRDVALSKYAQVFFICQSQNYDLVTKAVGVERTISRGKDLRDFVETL